MHISSTLHKRQRKHQQGFTLIELLVVIAIISVISGLVMISVKSAHDRANDVKIISDMDQMKNALEIYSLDHNGTYPQTGMVVQPSTVAATGGDALKNSFVTSVFSLVTPKAYASVSHTNQLCVNFDNLASVLVPKYIASLPKHPLDDLTTNCYKYKSTTTTAVVFAGMLTEKYSNGFNKQSGAALGLADNSYLEKVCAIAGYPIFNIDGTGNAACLGSESADRIIGITSGKEAPVDAVPQNGSGSGSGSGSNQGSGTLGSGGSGSGIGTPPPPAPRFYDGTYRFFGRYYCSRGYSCFYGNGVHGYGYYGLVGGSNSGGLGYYDGAYRSFGLHYCAADYNCFYGDGLNGYGYYGKLRAGAGNGSGSGSGAGGGSGGSGSGSGSGGGGGGSGSGSGGGGGFGSGSGSGSGS